MIYERRYIQFNDLVFDSFDMISGYDGSWNFKGSSTEYSYRHGSYRPFKKPYLYVSERQVSMTITFDLRKVPCDQRRFFTRFADEELAKVGKLWCIKNGQLMWAIAAVDSISENYSRRDDRIVYDVNFVIPGGVWHKADTSNTFLVPYDICNFMDCKGYRDVGNCNCCDMCTDGLVNDEDCGCCCNDSLTEDMMLCHNLDEVRGANTVGISVWDGCNSPYRIVYDCEAGSRFMAERFHGQRLCVEDLCDGTIIAGRVYSDTEIPTDDVTVTLRGKFSNPWITINENTNIIEGEYDGVLIIKSNGDVYYTTDEECCEPTLLDPTVWEVPSGMAYGWEINPGYNSVVVHLNTCCSGPACVWVDADAIAM